MTATQKQTVPEILWWGLGFAIFIATIKDLPTSWALVTAGTTGLMTGFRFGYRITDSCFSQPRASLALQEGLIIIPGGLILSMGIVVWPMPTHWTLTAIGILFFICGSIAGEDAKLWLSFRKIKPILAKR